MYSLKESIRKISYQSVGQVLNECLNKAEQLPSLMLNQIFIHSKNMLTSMYFPPSQGVNSQSAIRIDFKMLGRLD